CSVAFLFLRTEAAIADLPALSAAPGENVTVPASSGWEVLVDVCGQFGTVGPTGSTYQVVPSDAATVSGIDSGSSLNPAGNIGIGVSPNATPGLVIGITWTTFHDGCFSAHGGVTLTVGSPGGGGGGGIPGGGGGGGGVGTPGMGTPPKPFS